MKREIGRDICLDWNRRLSTIDMLADFSLFTLLVFLQNQLLLAINSYFILVLFSSFLSKNAQITDA